MNPDTDRRSLLRAGGASAVGLLAGCLTDEEAEPEVNTERDDEQEETDVDPESTPGDGERDEPLSGTATITVGPEVDPFVFDPEDLGITPDTTVQFVWATDTHNVVVRDQPDGAGWEGHEAIEDAGAEYQHTFEVPGSYEYVCEPHDAQGMEGTLQVVDE